MIHPWVDIESETILICFNQKKECILNCVEYIYTSLKQFFVGDAS